MNDINALLAQLRTTLEDLRVTGASTIAEDMLTQHIERGDASRLVEQWLQLSRDNDIRRARNSLRRHLYGPLTIQAIGGWQSVTDVHRDTQGNLESYGSSGAIWYRAGYWSFSIGTRLQEEWTPHLNLDEFLSMVTPSGELMRCREPLSGVACHALNYVGWCDRMDHTNDFTTEPNLARWERVFQEHVTTVTPFWSFFIASNGATYGVLFEGEAEPDAAAVTNQITRLINADVETPAAHWHEGWNGECVLTHGEELLTIRTSPGHGWIFQVRAPEEAR